MTGGDMHPDGIRLIRRYYLYSGLYTLSASVIWGVNTLFLLDAGLSISEVFIANSAWSAGTMIFEIPTGVVADTIGRRASFLLSLAVLAITTMAYVGLATVGAGLMAFAAVSILIGLGFTFYSGAMEAWLVDGLASVGYVGALDRVFSRGHIVSGVAMLVGTVGGGALGDIDLAVPFVVRSILLVVLFVLAYNGMRDLGFKPKRVPIGQLPGEAAKLGRIGVSIVWGERSLRLLALATAVQSGIFAWAWYAWQPYFLELLGQDAIWVAGVVAALLAISMMVGNALVEILSRLCGRRTTLFMWAGAALAVSLVGVGAVTTFVPAVALLFLGGVAIGAQSPVRQAFVHQIVPSEQRATAISFDAMISGGGSVVGQTGLGAFAERQGFSAAYVVGGVATVIAMPLLALTRREGHDADLFTGDRPEYACATPGVPAVSAIDGEVTLESL